MIVRFPEQKTTYLPKCERHPSSASFDRLVIHKVNLQNKNLVTNINSNDSRQTLVALFMLLSQIKCICLPMEKSNQAFLCNYSALLNPKL